MAGKQELRRRTRAGMILGLNAGCMTNAPSAPDRESLEDTGVRMPSRWLTLLNVLLAVAFCGCSKDENPTGPNTTTERHGTPIAGARAIHFESRLMWSSLTNELVGGRYFLDEGLIAIHSRTGASRLLDSLSSVPVSLAPDGSASYYIAFSDDSIFARRVALVGPASPHTLLGCSGIFCFSNLEPASDGNLVAISTFDSVIVHRLTNGQDEALTDGLGLEFSPDASRLLVTRMPPALSSADIVTLATGASEPAVLGVPDTAGGYTLRWFDTEGLEVLFLSSDQRSLLIRHVDEGVTQLVWESPDTLHGPLAWSESGRFVASWTSRRLASGADRWELHGIDLQNLSERVLAYGEYRQNSLSPASKVPRLRPDANIFRFSLRAVAFSPSETEVAYVWFDGRLFRVAWSSGI